MEIDYNIKAFFYILILAGLSLIVMIYGYFAENQYAYLVGGILLLVSILITLILTGIIFAIRMQLEEKEIYDDN